MAYDVGARVRLPVNVRDPNGDEADATMAVSVLKPDGTPAAIVGTIQHPNLGDYFADVDASTYGPWQWQWTASGAVVGVYTGQFFVRAPGPRLLSLTEVKKHLQKSLDDTTDDDELRDWIDATRWVIESITGPVLQRTIIESHDGSRDRWSSRRRAITLRTGPAMSVTTVQERWAPDDVRMLTADPGGAVGLSENQWAFDPATRRLTRRNNGYDALWAPGVANITVTYVVGQQFPRENIRAAALELIAHVWRSSQFLIGRIRVRVDEPNPTPLTVAVPNRVRELLGKTKRAPMLG